MRNKETRKIVRREFGMIKKITLSVLLVSVAMASQQQKEANQSFSLMGPIYRAGIIIGENIAFYARNGSMKAVRWFIDNGADINNDLSCGYNSLMLACAQGHLPVVELLIKAGANVNYRLKEFGVTPLICAAANAHASAAEMLIHSGAHIEMKCNMGWTALMYAARYAASKGKISVIDVLLSKPNERLAECVKPYIPALPVQRIILAYVGDSSGVNDQDAAGETALMQVMRAGDTVAIVDKFIKAGADVNILNNVGGTAFMMAAQLGRVSALKYFLKRKDELKLDVNKRTDKYGDINENLNAVGLACQSGKTTCLKLLLVEPSIDKIDVLSNEKLQHVSAIYVSEHRPKMNALLAHRLIRNHDHLFISIARTDIRMFKQYLKCVKDLRMYDAEWENPLHKAFRIGLRDDLTTEQFNANVTIIVLLISYQSCLLLEENKNGETPFYLILPDRTQDSFAKNNLRAIIWQLIKNESKPIRNISAHGKYIVDVHKKIN